MLIPNIDKVRVSFNGEEVGTIAAASGGVMAFEYADSWLSTGFSISPLSLPLRKGVFVAKAHPLDGVFGVFDDSLPDGWGRLLVDRVLASRGIDSRSVGFLARLSFVGSSGMGALEYEPETVVPTVLRGIDFDEIAEECANVLASRTAPEAPEGLDRLFALGGSSGGARPKVLTTIDDEPWIVKFPSSIDPDDIGEREFAIACLAGKCGVDMPEVRLLPSERCSGYFAVKRFDRSLGEDGTRKIHMASAGALLETSHRFPNLEYETLMRLSTVLAGDARDCERLYRLMCFNVFVGNRDDHAKNFSFLYDAETEKWSLAPAYDITQNAGMYGERATTVNGKGRQVLLSDLVAVAAKAALPERLARDIAEEMREEVSTAGLLDCE